MIDKNEKDLIDELGHDAYGSFIAKKCTFGRKYISNKAFTRGILIISFVTYVMILVFYGIIDVIEVAYVKKDTIYYIYLEVFMSF